MLRLTPSYKDVFAVPVVMEGSIENDDSASIEAERKALHYGNKNYYDPEVLSHEYEVTKDGNGLNRAFSPYKG